MPSTLISRIREIDLPLQGNGLTLGLAVSQGASAPVACGFFVLRPAVPCGLGRASLILDGLVKSTSKGQKVKIFSLFFSEVKGTLSV